MRLQQNTIIIHDKLFIIANLFGGENVMVLKSLRQKIFTLFIYFLVGKGTQYTSSKFIETSIL
jgi:hypothetical protein